MAGNLPFGMTEEMASAINKPDYRETLAASEISEHYKQKGSRSVAKSVKYEMFICVLPA